MTTIRLDPASPVALYLQIADEIRRLVALGALKPGDRLPTVRELAARTRVNRNTSARAIQQLESEGVVRTRVGQGTFIADGADGFSRRRRDTIVDEAIDRLIVEARTAGLELGELPARLERRLRRFRHLTESGGDGEERA